MSVLVTAFEPFEGRVENQSARVLEELKNCDRAILPVSQETCFSTFLKVFDPDKHQAVILMGEAMKRSRLTYEYFALNLDHYRIPDNAGRQPQYEMIMPKGPHAYSTTMREVLKQWALKEPVEVSFHAGTYVCNHIYYQCLHHFRDQSRATVFLHVPQKANRQVICSVQKLIDLQDLA